MLLRESPNMENEAASSDELSYNDFSNMMIHLTGAEWAASELQEWFNHLDADGSGTISLDEFFQVSLSQAVGGSPDQHAIGGAQLGLKEVFEEFDTNGTGVLAYREFERAARKMSYGSVARELFDQFDQDKSYAHARTAPHTPPTRTRIILTGTAPSRLRPRSSSTASPWPRTRRPA